MTPRRAKELPFIASMGIYVAKASAIKDLLTQHFPSQHDFGSDIIPGAKDLGFHVQVRSELSSWVTYRAGHMLGPVTSPR